MITNKQAILLQTVILVSDKDILQFSASATMRHTTTLHHSVQLLRLRQHRRIPLAARRNLRNQLRPHGARVLVHSLLLELDIIRPPLSHASARERLLVKPRADVPDILNSRLLQRGAARDLALPEGRFGSLQLHSASILRF